MKEGKKAKSWCSLIVNNYLLFFLLVDNISVKVVVVGVNEEKIKKAKTDFFWSGCDLWKLKSSHFH